MQIVVRYNLSAQQWCRSRDAVFLSWGTWVANEGSERIGMPKNTLKFLATLKVATLTFV